MKKLFLTTLVAVFTMLSVNAQQFNLGVSAGLPVGDADDGYTFSLLIDANYLWEVSDQVDLGVATGLSHSFGDEIYGFDVDDATFLPIALATRFRITEEFTFGADLGYGIGIAPDDNDGGFYYAPKLQYSVTEIVDIVAAYRGTSVEGGDFNILSLGVEFGL